MNDMRKPSKKATPEGPPEKKQGRSSDVREQVAELKKRPGVWAIVQIEYANHLRDWHLDGSAWIAWLRGEHWIAGVDVMHEAGSGMSVTHYADIEDGITFVDELTVAPVPSLCGDGEQGDLMTFNFADVTCPGCIAELSS